MRILYYFPELPTPMSQWQRFHIFDELKHFCIQIDSFNPLEYSSLEEVHENVLKRLQYINYDLFFTNQCNENILQKETILAIKGLGIPTLSLRCDNLVLPYIDKKLSPLFDLVWLTAKETQHLYKKWGAKTIFAPYGANPFVFRPEKGASMNRRVCFIGTPYGSRSSMINALTNYGVNTDVYYKTSANGSNTNESQQFLLNVKTYSKIYYEFNNLTFSQGRKLLLGGGD